MTAFAVFQPFSSRFTLGMCIVPGFSCFVFALVGLFLVCLGNLFATVCVNVDVFFLFLGFC